MKINYKEFIEDNFDIINKDGVLVPFVFNETQSFAYSLLEADYPDFQGIRENWLKFRQWGGSSMIEGIYTADFILAELGEIPQVGCDIYSHKDEETTVHFRRMSHFFDSWLKRAYQTDDPADIQKLRKMLLKSDEDGSEMLGVRGSSIETKTASAKVSGRGGTKQNQLYTEIAFYPNTEIMNAKKLVVGATKQVKDGIGKIIKETTGNLSGDYFHTEYEAGKKVGAEYKSRFFAWYLLQEYQTHAPDEWIPPLYYQKILNEGKANKNQCFWHFRKTKQLEDLEEMREFPTYDVEAFLTSGSLYFSKDALTYYANIIKNPIYQGDDLLRYV